VTTSPNFNPAPTSYSGTNTLLYGNRATTNLYYNLGIARDDVNGGGSTFGYRFGTPAVALYTPAGADFGLITTNNVTYGGNLVPNASFENSAISFFQGAGGGTYVADAGKQGSQVLQNGGTADMHIGVPVIPDRPYLFDFWYRANTTGGAQLEWGFGVPSDGFAVASGNSSLSTGTGDTGWQEMRRLFTPAAGQTTWYFGGMANVGNIRFDSFYLAEALAPEPSTLLLFGTGGLLVWQRRRSRRR
jgi:hypothetical protein